MENGEEIDGARGEEVDCWKAMSNMTLPVIPDGIRLVLVAFGVCCLLVPLLTLWEYRDWKTAPGVAQIYPDVAYGRTNMRTQVAYTRDDGTRTVVMSSTVPAGARNGDKFTVLYDPHYMKASEVYTFDTFWSFPIYATVFGVVLMSLGLFARARRRTVFTEFHADAAANSAGGLWLESTRPVRAGRRGDRSLMHCAMGSVSKCQE